VSRQLSKYINLTRLEYSVTYQCTSRCRHCYAHAEQPPGSPRHIDAGLAVHIVREIGQRHPLGSVMTFGGEPLLYPEVVCAIHAEAKALGIPTRHVITNGYWTRDESKIRAVADALVQSGVNGVFISVDAFHQECVPLEVVKRSAAALWDAGLRNVRWNPCWLVSEDDDNVYNHQTRAILDELETSLPMVPAGDGNVMEPEGKALANFRAYFRPGFDWPRKSCQDVPYMSRLDDVQSICAEPNGDIPVCDWVLGNAAREDVTQILARYDPYADPAMKLILEEGVEGIVRQARAMGIELREEGYYSICDLCTSLRAHLASRTFFIG
jgi:hypothetical protein